MLPVCGVNKKYRNLFHCVGFNGHGVAQASKMGKVMALEMLGIPQQEVALLKRRRIPLPPEPLKWIAVNGVQYLTGLEDVKVDKLLEANR